MESRVVAAKRGVEMKHPLVVSEEKEKIMLRTFTVTLVLGALTLGVSRTHAQPATKDIVDTAVAAGSFTTLAKALQAADLVETLKGAGPFTVFAPTDEAFAKLPAETLNDLLKPENKTTLRRILTYHVVPGRVSSSEVVKLQSARAASGDTIDINTGDATVIVDGARVVTTDIQASNGLIHVIDAVMLPDNTE
jgi:uncharacterized surface protein with fasciclin (FAS1) repeats